MGLYFLSIRKDVREIFVSIVSIEGTPGKRTAMKGGINLVRVKSFHFVICNPCLVIFPFLSFPYPSSLPFVFRFLTPLLRAFFFHITIVTLYQRRISVCILFVYPRCMPKRPHTSSPLVLLPLDFPL